MFDFGMLVGMRTNLDQTGDLQKRLQLDLVWNPVQSLEQSLRKPLQTLE